LEEKQLNIARRLGEKQIILPDGWRKTTKYYQTAGGKKFILPDSWKNNNLILPNGLKKNN
jgi:hypothetical protein